MEQARLFVAIALSFLVIFVWQFFMVEPDAPPPVETDSVAEVAVPPAPKTDIAKPDIAATDFPTPSEETLPARVITIDTPLYIAKISERGAVFESIVLKKYRETAQKDSPMKALIPKDVPGGTVYTGFSGGDFPNLDNAVFTASVDADNLSISSVSEDIVFSYASPEGIVMEKRFRFSPDTYLVGFDLTMKNMSARPVEGALSVGLSGQSSSNGATYGFEGPSALIDNSLEQIKIKSIEDKNIYDGKIGWAAIEGRYFFSAIIPKASESSRLHLSVAQNDLLRSQYVLPAVTLEPSTVKTFAFDLFFGPKSLKILSQYHNGLDKLIHFGMFDILAKPCLWLMNYIYSVIPNYGVAIIILTIIIKLILWPLGNKSYASMNQMKKIQPLMAEIREKHKDDKKKMNEELMGLYRIYKVNPMGGCLPMVLQIPVFFALYRMLYEAIELRHAPFVGWINDLSAPDRLFRFDFSIPFMEPPYGVPVLTIIMGATMLLQQKMSPPPGDPTQAKMMMLMPVVFTFIFINFSSGLVLYWLVNNILSIAQQYYIGRKNA
ncbi:membrane protein insertase YidC [Desulfococcus multivorans]|uniref:Membrane protein insertase YidC n=1 Tax=Desulfococcus multivorans DSM 2059 TaxID=1121405 RepID=S7TC03_DESML|nr:membrane protein insertase YidC [Desulfococcus multivorans]AOY60643.1 OxaA: inner membrane protein [Desulfococcus multivorans]AQV02730.2 membrane protein insertase YidC [Desulfococcus multivorans]EPR34697.1 Membrane protein oxaA [Desulfococcus multivorans DSM 2059]SKA03135.1 protein translocase subunit yidC [Desulfococcus multivorans DSM 2059]